MLREEDQKIWLEIKQGEEKAFDILFRRYYKYLVSIAVKYGLDLEASKDIAQDVFSDLWNRKSEIEIMVSIKFFLRKAVINKCLALKKKSQRLVLNEEVLLNHSKSINNIESQYQGKELKEVIDLIIASLPGRCQEVFILSRNENLSHKEIAERMNISTKTIENQMTKALKTLRNELKKWGFLSILKIITLFI